MRHNLRRISGKYGTVAWQAYRASEASLRLKLGVDRLADFLEWGDELSARYAKQSGAGTWDFIHIAAAQRPGIEVFIACDAAQAELARISGLNEVHLFKIIPKVTCYSA